MPWSHCALSLSCTWSTALSWDPVIRQRRPGDVAAQLFKPISVVCLASNRGVQAETVDVGAQSWAHCGLAWHRTPESIPGPCRRPVRGETTELGSFHNAERFVSHESTPSARRGVRRRCGRLQGEIPRLQRAKRRRVYTEANTSAVVNNAQRQHRSVG